ncbi:MAG: ribosome assembly cofactor RimP [Flavobacteriales bacterium]|nr:ribosome assembly cofactor RimP [Flavobacteriales bacterium]
MINDKHIRELVVDALGRDDLFVVDISIDSTNRINVIIDSDKTVAIKDCIAVSRSIEGQLDRDIEDFSLEVASAGLGQPLKMLRQYNKYLGKNLEITVDTGVKLSGELTNVNGEYVELLELNQQLKGRKVKNDNRKVYKLAMNNIKQAKAIVTI